MPGAASQAGELPTTAFGSPQGDCCWGSIARSLTGIMARPDTVHRRLRATALAAACAGHPPAQWGQQVAARLGETEQQLAPCVQIYRALRALEAAGLNTGDV
jgi:hypothetical protein